MFCGYRGKKQAVSSKQLTLRPPSTYPWGIFHSAKVPICISGNFLWRIEFHSVEYPAKRTKYRAIVKLSKIFNCEFLLQCISSSNFRRNFGWTFRNSEIAWTIFSLFDNFLREFQCHLHPLSKLQNFWLHTEKAALIMFHFPSKNVQFGLKNSFWCC